MTERKTRLENLKNKNIGKAAPAEVGKSTNKSIAEAGKDLGL